MERGLKVVVGAFLASGTVHLVKPEVYEPLMPSWVPAHRDVLVWSGVAELVCAGGLMLPPTRRVSGLAAAALLSAVYVGNVHMARQSLKTRNTPYKLAAVVRLPLQFPMIRSSWRAWRAA